MTTFLIKQGGKTVIKTALPATAAKYQNKPGYRVLTIPASR